MPVTSAASSRARARRRRLIYGTAVGLIAIVFFAALGGVAALAAAASGLAVFAAGQTACRHQPRPAARRYPDTLTGRAESLAQDLTALGHEMRWSFDGGETASTFTGTCHRCDGTVTATRPGPMDPIAVSWPGRPLLASGRPPVLHPCGSRR
jgi:hypothetical protein